MVGVDYKRKLECWNDVDIVPFDKRSKNDKFLILEKGEPTFFLKKYNKNEFNINAIAKRERNVLAFFNQNLPAPFHPFALHRTSWVQHGPAAALTYH